jgi:glycosyltransferase involved in cell wall biosynthesis
VPVIDSAAVAQLVADTATKSPCLRVLLVSSDTYPPTRVDVTALFGSELAGRGHAVDLILQSETSCARPYQATWEGGQVWVGATNLGHSLLSRIHKHVLSVRNDLKLLSRLKHGNYQLVIVKDKFISAALALLAAARFKCRFIYWLSYPFPEFYLTRARDGTARYPWLYLMRGAAFRILLYRLLLPRADHVFVQSEQMRRNVALHGIPLSKMTSVPMGIQPQMFDRDRSRAVNGLSASDRPRILYLGALDRARRLDFLLRVMVKVRAHAPMAQLVLVGRGDDPEDERFLLAEARKLGLEQALVMTGQLERTDALERVAGADVCVSPLPRSPLMDGASPTKVVEYMAMGKAVVASDLPEQQDLIERSGGGYCVPYDEDAFAEAVLKLAAHPERAREMGQRGRQYVFEHRTYAVIADVVERDMLRVAESGTDA